VHREIALALGFVSAGDVLHQANWRCLMVTQKICLTRVIGSVTVFAICMLNTRYAHATFSALLYKWILTGLIPAKRGA
jgi:hypothetical protein